MKIDNDRSNSNSHSSDADDSSSNSIAATTAINGNPVRYNNNATRIE